MSSNTPGDKVLSGTAATASRGPVLSTKIYAVLEGGSDLLTNASITAKGASARNVWDRAYASMTVAEARARSAWDRDSASQAPEIRCKGCGIPSPSIDCKLADKKTTLHIERGVHRSTRIVINKRLQHRVQWSTRTNKVQIQRMRFEYSMCDT